MEAMLTRLYSLLRFGPRQLYYKVRNKLSGSGSGSKMYRTWSSISTREKMAQDFNDYCGLVRETRAGLSPGMSELRAIRTNMLTWESRLQNNDCMTQECRNEVDSCVNWCNQRMLRLGNGDAESEVAQSTAQLNFAGILKRADRGYSMQPDFQVPERDEEPARPARSTSQESFALPPLQAWTDIELNVLTGEEELPTETQSPQVTSVLSKLSPSEAQATSAPQVETQTLYYVNSTGTVPVTITVPVPDPATDPEVQTDAYSIHSTATAQTAATFHNDMESLVEKINDIWRRSQCQEYSFDNDDFSNMTAGLKLVEKTLSTELVKSIDDLSVKKAAVYEMSIAATKKRLNPFEFATQNGGNSTRPPRSKHIKRKKLSGNTIIETDTPLPHNFDEDMSTPCRHINWQELMEDEDVIAVV